MAGARAAAQRPDDPPRARSSAGDPQLGGECRLRGNQRRVQSHRRRPTQGPQTREHRCSTRASCAALLAEAQRPSRRAVKRGTLSSQPWFYPARRLRGVHRSSARRSARRSNGPTSTSMAGTVTIRESLSEPRSGLAFKRPKNGKVRTITIGAELAAILRTHKAKQAEEQLFLGEAYKKLDLVFATAGRGTRYARGTSGRPLKTSSNARASHRSRCTISAIRMLRYSQRPACRSR